MLGCYSAFQPVSPPAIQKLTGANKGEGAIAIQLTIQLKSFMQSTVGYQRSRRLQKLNE